MSQTKPIGSTFCQTPIPPQNLCKILSRKNKGVRIPPSSESICPKSCNTTAWEENCSLETFLAGSSPELPSLAPLSTVQPVQCLRAKGGTAAGRRIPLHLAWPEVSMDSLRDTGPLLHTYMQTLLSEGSHFPIPFITTASFAQQGNSHFDVLFRLSCHS